MALLRALDIIKKGTFASKGLPKSINDYFVANKILLKNSTKFIDKLFIEVLDRYDLSSNIESEIRGEQSSRGIVNPTIVLTQSFS